MGLTFKENCPDLRNSGVTNIIKELINFDCKLDLYDPWANRKEIKEIYNKELKTKIKGKFYDANYFSCCP